ncbi:MAG: NAD-dependent epimerase/dehydratase family protein [Planctomycetota bacterium]
MAVTAVGGGVGQAVLRALATTSLSVRTVGLDTRALAPGLFWADAAHLVPLAANEDAYLARLLEIVEREGVEALVPGLDAELRPLFANAGRLREAGCRLIGGGLRAVRLCRDKRELARFCRARDLPFARTFTMEEALEIGPELPFPLITKPRRGEASRDVLVVADAAELASLPDPGTRVVQPDLREEGRAGSRLVEQRGEVSVQLMISPRGRILGSFASVHRLKQGVPWEVVPAPDSPALGAGLAVAEALIEEGLRGPLNLQGLETPEGVRFFEANARFTGITGVRHAMGYREVEAALRAFLLDDDAGARRCLVAARGLVATRHVEETVVSMESVPRESAPTVAVPGAEPPRRVLVTGATGYAGASLVRRLLDQEEIEEVRAGVRDEAAGARLREALGEPSRLRLALGRLPDEPWRAGGIDVVVHAAAVRAPERGGGVGELFSVNTEGTRRVAEEARAAGVRRLVFLSSQSVYGTRRPPPWPESLLPSPESSYATSKWAAKLLLAEAAGSGMEVVVLRASRIYGWSRVARLSEMPHRFADLAASGESIPLFGGGRARLDLLHLDDLCEAVVLALGARPAGECEVLNVGSGTLVSVAELAGICREEAEAAGLPPPPIEERDPDADYPDFGLDIRRARARLGFAPRVSLRAALGELVRAAAERRELVR